MTTAAAVAAGFGYIDPGEPPDLPPPRPLPVPADHPQADAITALVRIVSTHPDAATDAGLAIDVLAERLGEHLSVVAAYARRAARAGRLVFDEPDRVRRIEP